ncbi:unnamed protein product, partial [Ectocarpus fasciculatus]
MLHLIISFPKSFQMFRCHSSQTYFPNFHLFSSAANRGATAFKISEIAACERTIITKQVPPGPSNTLVKEPELALYPQQRSKPCVTRTEHERTNWLCTLSNKVPLVVSNTAVNRCLPPKAVYSLFPIPHFFPLEPPTPS